MVPFSIGPDVIEETITLVWAQTGSNLDLFLVRPDGVVIDASNAAAEDADFISGPAIEYLTLGTPMQGDWEAHVAARSGSTQYAVVFSAHSAIRMAASFDRDEYPRGAPIRAACVSFRERPSNRGGDGYRERADSNRQRACCGTHRYT